MTCSQEFDEDQPAQDAARGPRGAFVTPPAAVRTDDDVPPAIDPRAALMRQAHLSGQMSARQSVAHHEAGEMTKAATSLLEPPLGGKTPAQIREEDARRGGGQVGRVMVTASDVRRAAVLLDAYDGLREMTATLSSRRLGRTTPHDLLARMSIGQFFDDCAEYDRSIDVDGDTACRVVAAVKFILEEELADLGVDLDPVPRDG